MEELPERVGLFPLFFETFIVLWRRRVLCRFGVTAGQMNGDLTSRSGEYGLSLSCETGFGGRKRRRVGNNWLRKRSVGCRVGGRGMVWGRGGWAIVVDLSALCVHTAESTRKRGETWEAGHDSCFFPPFFEEKWKR